ncbi:MAG: GtrA family protein [Acidimicrobiales bacterium]
MTSSFSTHAWPVITAPRLRLIRFAAVGASGFVVNSVCLAFVSGGLGAHYLIGAVASTLVSTSSNFVLTERFVFADRDRGAGRLRRFMVFLCLSLITLVARGPILVGLTEVAEIHYLVSNAISLVALMLVRYQFSGSRIWPEVAS